MTSTPSTPTPSSRSTRNPSSSTSTGTTSSPDRATIARYSGANGSSSANRRAPRAASVAASSPSAWANPDATTTSAGSATVPRTRLRYPASAIAQLRHPVAAEVGEAVRGRRLEGPAERPDPGRPRELGHVGPSGPEVEGRGLRLEVARLAVGETQPVGHPRRAAPAADEVALGDELLVRLDDHARETPSWAASSRDDGTAQPPSEPPVADGLPQHASKLPVQGFW